MRSLCMSKRVTSFAVCLTFVLAAALNVHGQHYDRVDLTTNLSSLAPSAHVDANLVNAWGLAFSSTSFLWIADNGTGVATLYDGDGAPQSLVVTIPGPTQGTKSAPTGTVFNDTTSFPVGGKPAVFLFVTEDGTISGWNPTVNATNAVIAVNQTGKAIYKGCAIAQTRYGSRFYATNFQSGNVEAYDGNFQPVSLKQRAFKIPGIDQRFVPFNIQNVGGSLVVTFAFREPGSTDEEHGPGLGWVAVFDTDGNLLEKLDHGNFLNAPWGVSLSPAHFGAFSHRLLIGNFGDGNIHAFNLFTGGFEGTLLDANDKPIQVDGLWALQFGNDAHSASALSLFFTSGPNDENNGLFGKLTAVAAEQRGSTE